MKIAITKDVDAGHWRHLTQWSKRVFPEEGIGKEWTDVAWHIIYFVDEQNPVAHIGFDVFDIAVDGVAQKIIGVGGVVVRPEYQGQRIPEKLFDCLHRHGVEKTGIAGIDSYALFCPERLVSYYRKQGYRLHEGEVWFLQSGTNVLSTFRFMHRGGLATAARIELQSPPW